MIEVMIESIRVSLTNQQRIVVLREMDRERYLPIWIGPFEAESITIGLQQIEISRPQTHDLILNVIQAFGFEFQRVEIKFMREDVYYADMVLQHVDSGEIKRIDCRPSDALALVARKNLRVFVAEEIMDHAGIIPDENLQERTNGKSASSELDEPIEVVDEGRLSIFEDFLEKLDIDSDDDETKDKPTDSTENN